jgi:hypothetical protein
MEKNKLNIQYFDVHCQFEKSGYSIPVQMVSYSFQTDKSVIEHCKNEKLFEQEGDDEYVDYVTEIEESEYKDMKNSTHLKKHIQQHLITY